VRPRCKKLEQSFFWHGWIATHATTKLTVAKEDDPTWFHFPPPYAEWLIELWF
jgi:hypothetical protein